MIFRRRESTYTFWNQHERFHYSGFTLMKIYLYDTVRTTVVYHHEDEDTSFANKKGHVGRS